MSYSGNVLNTKMKITALLTSAVLLVSGVTATAAFAVPRDGGDWVQGTSAGRVWSNYWHPGVFHGSSVQGWRYVDSGCQAPNVWARATTATSPFRASGTFYRFC
jgi:hypothetical protein